MPHAFPVERLAEQDVGCLLADALIGQGRAVPGPQPYNAPPLGVAHRPDHAVAHGRSQQFGRHGRGQLIGPGTMSFDPPA